MSLALELQGFAAPRIWHSFFGRKGGAPEQTVTVHQVHSADCVFVEGPISRNDRPRADAMVTDVPGIILGIITADCGPVLLHGIKADGSPIIGATHAGWKGAVSGVLENTVRMMVEYGAVLESIVAAVGPCIAQKSYDVSMGFEEPFVALDADDERFFTEGQQEGKLYFDLPGYIAKRLAGAGVFRVVLSDVDTCINVDDYFSYRRATREGRTDDDRQMSCIQIYNCAPCTI